MSGPRRRAYLAPLLLALATCLRDPTPPLRVGMSVWTGYAPAYLAARRGWIGDSTQVAIVDADSPETTRSAYRNGALDAVAGTVDLALVLSAERPTTRVVMVLDVSRGGDAILGRAGLRDVSDLRGRRVGVERSSLGQYLLRRALEQAGVPADAVTLVPTEMSSMEGALLDGRVDAVVTFEPTRTRLLAHGAVQLFSSADIPGEVLDVLVADSATLGARGEDLQRFVNGWYQGRAALARDPDDAAHVVAPRLALTLAQFRAALALTDFPDSARAARLLSGEDPALRRAEHIIGELLRQAGVLDQPAHPERLHDGRFLAPARAGRP